MTNNFLKQKIHFSKKLQNLSCLKWYIMYPEKDFLFTSNNKLININFKQKVLLYMRTGLYDGVNISPKVKTYNHV